MEKKADLGLIGLAVMGQNLVLNMNDHGYTVAVFNRTVSKVDGFMENAAKGRDTIYGAHTVEEFVSMLERPRKVMLMVKAGEVVDKFIEMLLPHLEKGDLIIDGGNSHFPDTVRRTKYLEEKGLLYIGTGVSGGEEGARLGPSIMPGGSPAAWPLVKNIFQYISAKTSDGEACCEWVGEDGAGHYVKMVHNGIEYGDIQLICEAYDLMKTGLGLSPDEMSKVFADWNTAEQKGTGKWTAVNSLEMGMPVTLIGEAVYSRFLSALKDERVEASKILKGPKPSFDGDRSAFIEDIRRALLASKIVSYAQGFMLIRQAAQDYNWDLNYGAIALMWRAGCIIRSVFLGKIKDAFQRKPDLSNLLLDDYFHGLIDDAQASWRRVIARAAEMGIPVPAMTTALNFFDGYRSARLPANLLQAQRDYFGAHTYERVDTPRGEFFHTNWTGTGMDDVASGTYNA